MRNASNFLNSTGSITRKSKDNNTNNQDIINDICSFVANIYLGMRLNREEYEEFWINRIRILIDYFKEAKSNKNSDNSSTNNLIYFIKYLVEESNKDGDIINNQYIINNI